ncbi:MAG: CarD family transcriptional regulator [Slackia sp.]|nr:CarD family transcriptional regulator [Slackia sp.]
MFHKNDKVVYANYGACTVSETDVSMTMGGMERSYYVLLPLRKRGGTVYVPADHEELMRPVMKRDEAIALVEHYDEIAMDDFVDNNSRTVEEHFKKMLRRCDCATAICVVKTMQMRIAEQESRRHLPSSMYTRLLDQAEHQAASELSAALEIAEADVPAFIETHKLSLA